MKSSASSPTRRKAAAANAGERELLRDEGGKKIFRGDSPDYLVLDFSAGVQDPEGALRNEISSYLFEYLNGFHIPTHYVEKLSPAEMLVRKTDRIPVSVCLWNAGHRRLADLYGLSDAGLFEFPVIEHYVHRPGGVKTAVNEYILSALGVVSPEEFKQLNRIASKTNAVLRALAERRKLAFLSGEFSFGRNNGQIFVTDEVSSVNCRFAEADPKGGAAPELAPAALCDRLLMKT